MGNIFTKTPSLIAAAAICFLLSAAGARAASPDDALADNRFALEKLQRDAFLYFWDFAAPESGMTYEANYGWDTIPVTVGGTGFGIAALVAATDRQWVSREDAVARLFKITLFLRDRTPRMALHGAFPHWLNGATGEIIQFGDRDKGADIVETSLLMQGLLIARAYFNGPGAEAELRAIITGLWEDVDWNWFTAGQESGLFWHWGPEHGHSGLKILGYNECLITYILALSSPTYPISRATYDYWTSGKGYQPKNLYGYRVDASLEGGGPLFLTHYSFIGLDPRRMADSFVPGGYFTRNVRQVLSNRSYSLYQAPKRNKYSPGFWGLSAGHTKNGYAASEPTRDPGTIAPTAALASMPYTPHYAMQVLETIHAMNLFPDSEEQQGADETLFKALWGRFGPYDGISLRDKWVSDNYLAIDQLPMVCMVENYRSGLLWNLFMNDPDVRAGLVKAGIHEPELAPGFPEAVVTVVKQGKKYVDDAYEIRRHPDSGLYAVPFAVDSAGPATLSFTDEAGNVLFTTVQNARQGRNVFTFSPFTPADGSLLTLTLIPLSGETHTLPVRLH